MAAALIVSQTSALVATRASHILGLKPQPARFRLIGSITLRKQYTVRCDAEDGEPGNVKEAEEEGVRRSISKLDALLSNDSKKKLGFGTKPTLDTSPEAESTTSPADDVDFGALFAVDGPLPEILSGRLAMFGMACALVAEKVTGLTVLEQVFTHGNTGLVFFVGAVQLLTYASLTPITKGESVESRSLGPFTARAERWNGRAAMVGFLLLVVTETLRHAPLFQ